MPTNATDAKEKHVNSNQSEDFRVLSPIPVLHGERWTMQVASALCMRSDHLRLLALLYLFCCSC
jgi:hypothetical protein